MNEDSLVLAQIEDKLRQCESGSYITWSNFLDIRQCALAATEFQATRHVLYGGYEDAERRIMVFLPDYVDISQSIEEILGDDNPLEVLRVSTAKGSRALGHRDYLGSLLSLGIDRNISGDIIVRDNGADIIILKSMEEFLLTNYDKAGRTNLSLEIVPIGDLMLGEEHTSTKQDTVASLRLDNVLGSAFNLSRTTAQDAIKQGIVFVNGLQCTKADKEISEGDKIVLRGKGKVILEEVGKRTRKDRLFVTYKLYL